MPKLDKLIDLEQLQIVSKNKQKQIDNLKEKKVDKEEGKGLSSNDFTDSYKAQVEANTANRHTHSNKELLDTYTQTEANLADAVSKKHSHSNKSILDATTASYTTAEKTKLSGIESGAEANVQSDWEENDNSKDEFIKNKPEFERVDDRLIPILPYIDPDKKYNFIDHINEPTYRFTAPLNSKLLMLQSIAGNSNKIAPSTPSDDSVARIKTIPENTYKSQIDYIGGKSVKYNQLVRNSNFGSTSEWYSGGAQFSVNNNVATILANNQYQGVRQYLNPYKFVANHKYFLIAQIKLTTATTQVVLQANSGSTNAFISTTATTNWQILGQIFSFSTIDSGDYSNFILIQDNRASGWDNIDVDFVELINLTDKFGAGNEPRTVETAIPLLKANGYKLDGTDEYSVSKFKHAITTGVKYDGNLLNPNNTFVVPQFTDTIYFECSGSETYTLKSFGTYTGTFRIFYYDGTQWDTLSSQALINGYTFTVPSNATRIGCNGVTDEKVVAVKGTTAPSTYIPYVAPITKAIPSEVLALELYKSAGSVYDVIDCNNKTGTRKVEDDNPLYDLNWNYSSTYDYFILDSSSVSILNSKLKTPSSNSSVVNLEILGYKAVSWVTMYQNANAPDKAYCCGSDGYIIFKDTSITNHTYNGCKSTIDALTNITYELADYVPYDLSQYFTDGWNKVNLDKQYATCEMVVVEPIDMPNKVEYYGTIIHSLATAVKQDGFNMWDETNLENVSGFTKQNDYWVATGIVWDTINLCNYININSEQRYCISFEYIADSGLINAKITIKYNDGSNQMAYLSQLVGDRKSIVSTKTGITSIVLSYGSGGTYNLRIKDLCINISNQDLNGIYKPYKAPITRLLPNSEAKYSWGISDGVRNTRVFCDDECNPVNEGQLDVGNQDLGLADWTYSSGTFRSTNISSPDDASNLCPNYSSLTYPQMLTTDKSVYVGINIIQIHDELYTNTTIFKTANNGVPLFYEKATTDTETLDDFDFFFDCEEGDTFTIIGCELLQCYATYSFVVEHVE